MNSAVEIRPAGLSASARFFPELDGMRAVAILLVFCFHAFELFRDRAGPTEAEAASFFAPLTAFVYAGHTGVTLFFVLSAYLLARPFIAAHHSGAARSARTFYGRRALRILPAFYLAVVVATCANASQPSDLFRGLPYLLFADPLGVSEPMTPYSTVWWSLATEIQFYLVLPLLFVLLRIRQGPAIVALILSAWMAIWGWLIHQPIVGPDLEQAIGNRLSLLLSLVGRGFAFIVGVAVAWVHEVHGNRLERTLRESRWLRGWAADALLAVLLLGLGLILIRVAVQQFYVAEINWPSWHLYESLIWGAVLLLLTTSTAHSRRFLRGRLVSRVGVLSYSIYLTHYPLIFFVLIPGKQAAVWLNTLGIAGYWVAVVVCFGLCVLLSSLSYQFVELPFLQRKAKIG